MTLYHVSRAFLKLSKQALAYKRLPLQLKDNCKVLPGAASIILSAHMAMLPISCQVWLTRGDV